MTPVSPEDIYKKQLNNEVRRIKNDPGISINFKTAGLSQHVATADQARDLVINATRSSANELNLTLNGKENDVILAKVSLSSKYSSVLTVMNEAIIEGMKPSA